MRARITPDKKEISRICEEVWGVTTECLADNEATLLIAVAEHFKLGKKRLNAFRETLTRVRHEFDEYDKDGVFNDKLTEYFEYLGINPADLYDRGESFADVHRRMSRSVKPDVSYKEAVDIHSAMEKMKKIVS